MSYDRLLCIFKKCKEMKIKKCWKNHMHRTPLKLLDNIFMWFKNQNILKNALRSLASITVSTCPTSYESHFYFLSILLIFIMQIWIHIYKYTCIYVNIYILISFLSTQRNYIIYIILHFSLICPHSSHIGTQRRLHISLVNVYFIKSILCYRLCGLFPILCYCQKCWNKCFMSFWLYWSFW